MDYHIIGGDGKVYGPKPESEIRAWIREGRLDAESRICRAGGEDWLTLDRLPEFAMDLGAASGSNPNPDPQPATGSGGPVLEPLPNAQSPPLPGAQPGPAMPHAGPAIPQPGYPQQPPGPGYPGHVPQPVMMAPAQTTNPMAITGMIMGILAILASYPCCGIPFNILGIIFSSVGLSQIKKQPSQAGRGMAIAGLICSIISLLIIIAFIILGVTAGILDSI